MGSWSRSKEVLRGCHKRVGLGSSQGTLGVGIKHFWDRYAAGKRVNMKVGFALVEDRRVVH